MSTIYAFLRGMQQFRYSFTSHYTSYRMSRAFDYGRELAHILTFRRYDK